MIKRISFSLLVTFTLLPVENQNSSISSQSTDTVPLQIAHGIVYFADIGSLKKGPEEEKLIHSVIIPLPILHLLHSVVSH